jgi:predicted cobalt transporter CbtA
MIFSRIIYSAILIGAVTGVLLSCLQVVSLNPIIFAAETYEVEAAPASAGDGHIDHSHGHSHDADAWAPADGIERTAYTFLANVLAGTGFAAILLALMSQFWLSRNRQISWTQGANSDVLNARSVVVAVTQSSVTSPVTVIDQLPVPFGSVVPR